MPKKDYKRNNHHGMPLFTDPYYGGRVEELEDGMEEIHGRLDFFEDRLDGFDGKLEEILRACQGTKKETPAAKTVDPAPEPKPEPVKTAKQPEPAPEPKPEPKPATKMTEPKPEPVPSKESWPRVGYAYIWWDAQNRVWVPCTDIWAAKQAGNGVYHPVWAWLDESHRLVRFLTKEEIMRYCP